MFNVERITKKNKTVKPLSAYNREAQTSHPLVYEYEIYSWRNEATKKNTVKKRPANKKKRNTGAFIMRFRAIRKRLNH